LIRLHGNVPPASTGRANPGLAAVDILARRFSEAGSAFGPWETPGLNAILYAIDNEIHHRGQGYVYLRAPGLEPPPFWKR
jgi:hypothetical protein